MGFEFDSGPTGGSGGPFLNWSARGTMDGNIPQRSFFISEGGEKTNVTEKLEKGCAFDLASLKTGWCYTAGVAGVAPEWRWNENLGKFGPKPDEDREWKRGFQIDIALDPKTRVTWQQASAGAFGAMAALMSSEEIREKGDGEQLPVVQMSGVEASTFSGGKSTASPNLVVKKWAKRPDILATNGHAKPEADDDNEF